MRVAILSHVLPPSSSGQALLIYRLLKDLPPEDYCLPSQWDQGAGGAQAYSDRLPGRFRHVAPRAVGRGQRFDAVKWLNLKLLGREVAAVAADEGCAAVVAFSGSPTDLPAGLAASRILNVPFYAYLCDYYSHQHTDAQSRAFAEKHEAEVLRGARGVVVPNEFLRDELRRRYGVEPVIVRNSCDLGAYEAAAPYSGAAGGERRIVYTGAVYEAHYGAFRNLVRAIDALGRRDVRLHLYTAQPPRELEEAGISGPVVVHGHAAPEEVPAIQKQADLLFLPLAFDSPYPEIIKTSAPFKTGEYLAARRPVLVHAPRDSFLSWYFREHACGVVADEDDAGRLTEELRRVLGDSGLHERLSANAWERAREDFSVAAAQAAFARLLGLKGAPGR